MCYVKNKRSSEAMRQSGSREGAKYQRTLLWFSFYQTRQPQGLGSSYPPNARSKIARQDSFSPLCCSQHTSDRISSIHK
jgi:hypothetical protein